MATGKRDPVERLNIRFFDPCLHRRVSISLSGISFHVLSGGTPHTEHPARQGEFGTGLERPV